MGPGNLDGAALAARFNAPQGVARDAAGNLYVADQGNFTVRKISPAGVVTTLAGQAGVEGSVDGVGSAARFAGPYGVAVDSAGSVYVADVPRQAGGVHAVRKISPSGAVSTLALSFLASQSFVLPFAITVDANGNLYVGFSNKVYKVTPNGVESILATVPTFTDPLIMGGSQSVPELAGIAVQTDGTVYAADSRGHVIRRIAPNGNVSTVAGREGCIYGIALVLQNTPCGPSNPPSVDGVGEAARFAVPRWLALDAAGDLLVVDGGNGSNVPGRVLRKVTPAGVVTTIASGFDGLGGLALDGQGVAYLGDPVNSRVLKKLPNQAAEVFVGPSQLPATTIFLNVTTDPSGQIYALERTPLSNPEYAIRLVKVSAQGTTTAVAQRLGGIVLPRAGLAADGAGNVYSTKSGANFAGFIPLESGAEVVKVSPAGVVTTVWATTSFIPARVALDTSSSFYIAGYNNGTQIGVTPNAAPYVVKLSPTGQVLAQWPLLTAGEVAPTYPYLPEIALDASGNLFVAVYNTIRKISPAGVLTVVTGSAGASGSADGTGDQARFGEIRGLALDAVGNIYAADATHNTVRKITPAGVVTTLVGKAGSTGILLGDLPGSLATPNGLALDASGFLYISTGQALLRVKLPQ